MAERISDDFRALCGGQNNADKAAKEKPGVFGKLWYTRLGNFHICKSEKYGMVIHIKVYCKEG